MTKFVDVLDTIQIGDFEKRRKLAITTTDGKAVRMTTPRMYMPFGLSGFVPDVGQTKWNIDFNMMGYDEEGNSVKQFFNIIRNVCDRLNTTPRFYH